MNAPISYLWTAEDKAAGLHAYAVLDAARSEHVLPGIQASGLAYLSLYPAEAAGVLADVAPYLVALGDLSSSAAVTLIEQGWEDDWGILLKSAAADPLALAADLRTLLTALLPDGSKVLLRFFDPRVLGVLLAQATTSQIGQFFAQA